LEDDNGPYNQFNGREADIWFDVQLGCEAAPPTQPTYDADVSKIAWERTAVFLKKYLGH